MKISEENKVLSAINRFVDLVVVNVLFLITSIPVITIGASISAMYHVLIRMTDETEGTIYKTYFKAFRSSFKKATIVWVPILLILYMLYYNLTFIPQITSGIPAAILMGIQALVALLVFCVVQYYFPLTGYFENTVGTTLKNAFLLSFAYLPKTLLFLALTLLIPFLVFLMPGIVYIVMFLGLIILFSAIAYIKAFRMSRIFDQIVE